MKTIVKDPNTVGIRELRTHLGHYVTLLRHGQRLTLTDRGQFLADVTPQASMRSQSLDPELEQRLEELEREGFLTRGNGQPFKLPRPIKIKGGPMSQTVIEGRR